MKWSLLYITDFKSMHILWICSEWVVGLVSWKDVASPVRRGWVCSWRMLDRKCQKHIWNSYIQEVYAWQWRPSEHCSACPLCNPLFCVWLSLQTLRRTTAGCERVPYFKHDMNFGVPNKVLLQDCASILRVVMWIYLSVCIREVSMCVHVFVCVCVCVCECKLLDTEVQILLNWAAFEKEALFQFSMFANRWCCYVADQSVFVADKMSGFTWFHMMSCMLHYIMFYIMIYYFSTCNAYCIIIWIVWLKLFLCNANVLFHVIIKNLKNIIWI